MVNTKMVGASAKNAQIYNQSSASEGEILSFVDLKI
jgi:hypothetical protein